MRPVNVIAIGILLVFLVLNFMMISGVFSIGDTYYINIERRFLPPSSTYLFGTDELGRDMFSRTIYAMSLSTVVVSESLILSFILAILLGGIAGYYYRKIPDSIISWIIAMLYSIPFLLIVVALASVLRPDVTGIYLIIGSVGWAAPARIARADIARIRSAPFIMALKAFGFSDIHIFFGSILPIIVSPILQALVLFIPELVGTEVALSFFGLGVQPPTPSLGRLIFQGLSKSQYGWWLPLFPAVMLVIIMLLLFSLSKLLQKAKI